MPIERINAFAKTNFRNRETVFGIRTDDRRRHVYVIGKTGMGKTTMIENMIVQDIQAGNGVAFVDPHGDAVEKIINYIPSDRINDVVYFNPADLDFPIAFNPLESVDPKYKHLVASGLVGVFKKMWADSWGPRLEYILNNTILALLDTPGNTMLGIARILVDKKFRKKIVDNVRDPIVKSFWIDEFANHNEKFRSEAIAPIQNKVGQFLSSSVIRNVVGQTKSSIDLRSLIDNKKILLLNLSKGRIGEDNSALLGAMFITRLQLAAMSRVDIPEEQRPDFYLYVDEFQNFATESFASILSEARKYRLNLVIAHQYIEQLSEEVQPAVFGNVGTIIIFRIGAADAEALEMEFEPDVTPTDMVNLAKYNVYLKLMINGVSSSPFSAITLPPLAARTGNEDKVIKVSRERYANPREEIEEKITRWMGQEYHKESATVELSEEEQEDERGGVIFSGAQSTPVPVPIPAVVERKEPPRPVEVKQVPQSVKQPIQSPNTKPTLPPKREQKPDVWNKVAEEQAKRTDEAVKKISKALVFRFGDKDKQTSPTPPPPPSNDSDNNGDANSSKSLKPGETARF